MCLHKHTHNHTNLQVQGQLPHAFVRPGQSGKYSRFIRGGNGGVPPKKHADIDSKALNINIHYPRMMIYAACKYPNKAPIPFNTTVYGTPLGNQAIGGISIRMYASRTEIVSVVLHQRLVSTVIRSHQSGLGNTHRTHTGIHRWPFYGLQRSN